MILDVLIVVSLFELMIFVLGSVLFFGRYYMDFLYYLIIMHVIFGGAAGLVWVLSPYVV